MAYAGSVLVARSHTRVAFLALLAMAAAWGSTFLLIKDLVTRIPVADLLAVRFAIAAVALGLIVGPRLQISRPVLTQGALLGLLYGSAQILQTAGLAHTAASVSGFVTGLYVVATPLLTAVILRRRIANITWFAVFLALFGLGVLALRGFTLGYGELLTVIAALLYARHIVALGQFSTPQTAISLSLVQLIVIALMCAVAALWLTPGSGAGIQLPATGHDWLVVLYLALVASALDHGAADLGSGAYRAAPSCGDHGHGTGLGSSLRGGLRRRECHRTDGHRRAGHRVRDVPRRAAGETPR